MQAATPREEQDRRIAASLLRQLGEFAIHVGAAGVTDIMLNPDRSVWVHRAGIGKERVGEMAPSAAEAFIGTVASTVRAEINRASPILECELPSDPPFCGARIEALMRPTVSSPTFAIRFHAARLYTLDDYVADGIMTPRQRAILRDAAERRLNILVPGGTGAGKTTLLNAIIADMVEVSPHHRFGVSEDTSELRCHAKDAVLLRATDHVGQQRILKALMRLAPDRIIIGEVRGGEALTLIKAWNTGHEGGASTVHANSARAALARIEDLILEVSQAPQRERIAAAINLIVHIGKERGAPWRRVKEIVAVKGYENGNYRLETVE